MASREFTDHRGRRWLVWEVETTLAERRRGLPDRRPEPRADRRVSRRPRLAVKAMYVNGWLAFEAPGDRRRLVPVPAAWDQATDAELEAMCDRAAPARPPRRLIE